MIPSMNSGAVGTLVDPAYGTIWRTAMMSSTNVSGPTRNVMRRSSRLSLMLMTHPSPGPSLRSGPPSPRKRGEGQLGTLVVCCPSPRLRGEGARRADEGPLLSFRAAQTARNPPPKDGPCSVCGRFFGVFAPQDDIWASRVKRRSSFDPELAHLVVEAADRIVEQIDRLVHVARRAAVAVGDRAHLAHRRDDLLALGRLARGDLEDLVDHLDHPLGGRGDHR